MSYDLLRDPATESVALIDSDIGRALGPVISGPGAEQVMEAFVGALGVDPAKLEHWEIQMRFNQFLEALHSEAEPEHPLPPVDEPANVTDPDGPEQTVPTEPAGDSSNGSATTSPPATAGQDKAAGAAEGAPTDEPPAPAPADVDPISPATDSGTETGGQPATGTAGISAPEPTRPTVPDDKVTCPQCEGWGTIAQGGAVVPCPLCEGTGSTTSEVAGAWEREQAAG